VLIVGFGVSTILTIQRESAVLVDQSKQAARKLTATLTASIEAAMLQERPDIARMQIMEMQKNSPVEGLTVYRNGVEAFTDTATLMQVMKEAELPGGVMESIKKMAHPAGPPMTGPLFQQAVDTMKTQESIEKVDGQTFFTMAQPIANQERCQGCHGTDHKVRAVVRVASSMEPVLAAVRTQRNRQMLVALLTIVAAAGVLGLAMRKVVVRPIQDLAQVAHRIGEGDFQARARTNSGDELARLGSAFNDMTDRLSTPRSIWNPATASWPPRWTSCRPRASAWKCWSSSRASCPSSCPTPSRSCSSATRRPRSWRSGKRKSPSSSSTSRATRGCPSRSRPSG
jgi:Signal transduction histidine kinase involved in nitrogen fixation and metabolism regulation